MVITVNDRRQDGFFSSFVSSFLSLTTVTAVAGAPRVWFLLRPALESDDCEITPPDE